MKQCETRVAELKISSDPLGLDKVYRMESRYNGPKIRWGGTSFMIITCLDNIAITLYFPDLRTH